MKECKLFANFKISWEVYLSIKDIYHLKSTQIGLAKKNAQNIGVFSRPKQPPPSGKWWQPTRHRMRSRCLSLGGLRKPSDRKNPLDVGGVPSRELTYPTEREKENHLQNAILGGYVSSLEGIRNWKAKKCMGFSAVPPRFAWFNAFNSCNDVIF